MGLGAGSKRALGLAGGRWSAQAAVVARVRGARGHEGRAGVRGAGAYGARWHAGCVGVRGTRARKERTGCAAGRLGRARQADWGARGRQTEARAVGARAALGTHAGCWRSARAHLGMLAVMWVVHSVHSACFDPVLTQYYS